MQKEVWGVNVIGNQGVNAVNDFSIRPSDDGTDVIVSVNGAELSGEEFAELKEIAETGGGGTPDPGDAVNADVLSVKVTPAVMRFVPAIKVGDHLSDVYGYVPAIPDFDALTYDSSIEGKVPAAKIFGFNIIVTVEGQTQTVSGDLLAFKLSEGSRSICGISPVQSDERFEETFMYLTGLKDQLEFDGWYPDAISGNFCSLADVMGLHGVDSYDIVITSLGQTSQDIWGQFVGGSKTVEEISPEVKEVIWEKPYPTITKVGQALVSTGEEYNLYPGVKVSSSGQFYFNNDEAIADSIITRFAENMSGGLRFEVQDNAGDAIMNISFKEFPLIQGERVITANVAIYTDGSLDSGMSTLKFIYSTKEGDVEATQIHVNKGWNDGVAYCMWDDGYQIKLFSGSHEITDDKAKEDYAPLYGQLITIQEGLFYGDIRNSSAQWQDINAKVKPDDYETTNMSDTSYLMVEDNNGKMKRLNYNDIKPTSGTLTLYSGSWSASGDEFRCDISIDGMTDSDTLVASPSTKSDAIAAQDANIYYADSNGSEVEFYCTTQPSNDIEFKYTLIKG